MNNSKTYFYMTYFTHLEPISGNLYTSYAHLVVSPLHNYLFLKSKKDIVEKKMESNRH